MVTNLRLQSFGKKEKYPPSNLAPNTEKNYLDNIVNDDSFYYP